jgi:hypothetical protein
MSNFQTKMSRSWWSCKSFFKRPTFFNSFSNTSPIQANFSSPFSSSKSFSIECYHSRISSIVRVFRSCNPATIFRRVISIIVNSVNLMNVARAWPHIFVKVLKTINPSFANRYSTSTITFIGMCFGIQTPCFKRSPYPEFWRLGKPMSKSIFVANQVTVFRFHTKDLKNKKVIFNKITKKEGNLYDS